MFRPVMRAAEWMLPSPLYSGERGIRRPVLRLTICLLFLSLTPVARAGDIVIGMSAAFTGPSRGLGIEMHRGASAYFAEVNARGGVHGRRIVLRAYDDGYNPSPALA